MVAQERSFSKDTPPSKLYADTDILINYLVDSQPHHERCRDFLLRVAKFDLTTLYVSSLSWMELVHVVSQKRFRDALPEEVQANFRLDRWDDAEVRHAYFDYFVNAFDELLSQFSSEEVALTSDVRAEAVDIMAEYGVDGQDAIHLASAKLAGVYDMASLDEEFRRVDWLYLWNDHIHAD